MALRKIVTVDDEEILRKKCRKVEKFDKKLHELLDDMAETLKEADGVGLAAPQIGILRQIVVIDTDSEEMLELINPCIVKSSGEQTTVEGCLSVPGVFGYTKRPMNVTVQAYDRNGNKFELEGRELLAKAFCHEIDHLNGKLFTDVVIEYYHPQPEGENE